MKLSKIFSVFIFLSAFAFQVSARDGEPKIVWKNLREKYESFYEIKPVIVNAGEQPVYFPCSDAAYGSFPNYGYDGKFKLLLNNVDNHWDWNVFICGTKSKKELKQIEKQEKEIEKLKRLGKYIPEGCKVEPNQEFTINFSEKFWNDIVGLGSEFRYYTYRSGKYKFVLEYEWMNAQNPAVSESPEFFVNLQETK